MTDASLRGRTALITGSVQGIGLAIAEAFARAGANIALHGLATPQQIDAATDHIRRLGAQVRFFDGDLRDRAAIDGLMEAVWNWGGGIDILINNAGVQKTLPFAQIDDATWDTVLSVNLTAGMATLRYALPRMAARGFGRVINIASVHGLVASVEKGPYVASKFGLVGLSKVAALEYARTGVTINCLCPGWTETALIEPQIQARAAAAGGDRQAGIAALLAEKQPSQRMSAPEEIAALALWLSSPLAHNVTGTAIPIDGGWTAQ
ncbi:3-hydroxybutyrate dehydrogenase [Asticcacaulis excentricus]|uniref:D-xylose 1-dehydrogenase n=1 Tax=Asticcacaulis excentricus TaxID=78587 RepID=A0A3G9GAY1_9CAUL|nr:3-hydroxybutyrate dehydrogenase [Asticcacaulis excentricus]BBF81628.1 D-beta-hydroxybutyrate dehydrogenase [Asticcacaulis excentricus]